MKNYLCIALLAAICNLQAMQEPTYTRTQVRQMMEAMEHFTNKVASYSGPHSIYESDAYYKEHRFAEEKLDTDPTILLAYYNNVVVPSKPQPFDRQRVIQSIKNKLSQDRQSGESYFAVMLKSYGIDQNNVEKATDNNLGIFFERVMGAKYFQ